MKLKEIRIRKGLTQADLAEKCGITQQSISQYESGVREPDLDMLRKLANVLECTLDELIRTGDPS